MMVQTAMNGFSLNVTMWVLLVVPEEEQVPMQLS